jgi:bacterioferritin-associated ferredoxin
MYLCLCKGLTESDVLRLANAAPRGTIQNGDALAKVLGLKDDDCCGRCAENLKEFLVLPRPA